MIKTNSLTGPYSDQNNHWDNCPKYGTANIMAFVWKETVTTSGKSQRGRRHLR